MRRIASSPLLTISTFLCACFTLAAQNGTVIVINADKHDVSPPVRGMQAYSTPGGVPKDTKPLRLFRSPGSPNGGADPVIQSSITTPAAPTSSTNFDGLGNGALGFTVNAAPPDTNGAVGATQYVQWVNSSFAVFDKASGALIKGPLAGNSLWSGFGGPCETNNDGDPIAQYDKTANRWVMSQFSVTGGPPYYQCFAISTTSDATGTYNRYSFQFSNFNDYPKIGVWPDGYYASFNMFSGNRFVGGQACAFDRNKMLTGAAATAHCFQLSTSYGGLLPADLDGATAPPAGSPNYFLAFGSNSLLFWKFHVDFTNSANTTFTGPTTIAAAAFTEACNGGACVPQPGTSQQLDSLADRLMYRLAYRNFGDHESMVVNHSVTAGASTGVRWYELRNLSSTPSIYQQGTYAPDSNYRWMGSAAMDKAGNLAVGYSISSSSVSPSLAYTGRAPTDPLGTLQAETTFIGGSGSQLTNLSRWGDYSAMTIDPVDDCTFWYTGEYMKTTGTFNWNTRITAFKFANCGATTSPDFTIAANPTSQTVTQGGTTGAYTISIGAVNGFTGTVTFGTSALPAGVTATFNPASVTTSGNSALTFATGSSTPAGTYNITVTGTSGATSHSTSVQLVVNAVPTPDFTISANPTSQTVTQGGTTGAYTIAIAALNGFTGTVTFGTSALPAGVAATFNPASVTTSGNSALTFATSSSTPAGTYNITVTGTSGATSHSTSVQLVVNAVAGADFAIAATPASQTVARGASATYTVTITGSGGFSGNVALSVSGLPNKATASFTPASVTGSGSSTLSITTSHKAGTGTFPLTITGTSGSLTHSAGVTLVVQ
jgi:hypothetical protein